MNAAAAAADAARGNASALKARQRTHRALGVPVLEHRRDAQEHAQRRARHSLHRLAKRAALGGACKRGGLNDAQASAGGREEGEELVEKRGSTHEGAYAAAAARSTSARARLTRAALPRAKVVGQARAHVIAQGLELRVDLARVFVVLDDLRRARAAGRRVNERLARTLRVRATNGAAPAQQLRRTSRQAAPRAQFHSAGVSQPWHTGQRCAATAVATDRVAAST